MKGKINPPCALCGGPHDFDTSVPSAVWNRVIRTKGLPEYLCTTCIVREFVKDGEGFTAQLWNEEFYGVPIEMIVNGKNANDAALVSDENTAYRVRIEKLETALAEERERCAKACDDIARSNSKGTFNDSSREVRAAEECAAAIRASTQPENDCKTTNEESPCQASSLKSSSSTPRDTWDEAIAIASHTQSQCLKHADNTALDSDTRSGWHTQSAGAWRVKAALEAARDRTASPDEQNANNAVLAVYYNNPQD